MALRSARTINPAASIEINSRQSILTFDLVAEVVGKRAAMFAGKAVWSDVVTTFPTDDGPHRIFDPLVKVAAEPLRNGVIPGLRIQQVLLERG